ncbi:hypothetical protein MKC48_21785, partial [[Clostridium] innocuum]|nr:hypothetical protein [[Clostridium] innocuum]MCR0527682.1 hypothetical protein [[Clostridium] innocuum]MCR0626451.1 hypothetical protein [[Clostridium] innocuum]
DVETTDGTSEQSGEIWATLSGKDLKQLKVTMPIRIDFAVVKGTPDNSFIVGDYKIKVASDSQVGVELTKINVQNADKGNWTLTNAEGIDATKDKTSDDVAMKTVAIQIAGVDLEYGPNTVTGFEVLKENEKSLGVDGTATKAVIDESYEAKAEHAFNVVYTIKQKEEVTTPAS